MSILLTQFEGCFKNQTISIPNYGLFYESQWLSSSPTMSYDNSFPIPNRVWWSMMFFTCYALGLLMYQQFIHFYIDNEEEGTQVEEGTEEGQEDKEGTLNDVVEAMRDMMDEISELSEAERQERSENYYILTNLLVNRFRIKVYEKILK